MAKVAVSLPVSVKAKCTHNCRYEAAQDKDFLEEHANLEALLTWTAEDGLPVCRAQPTREC